MPRVPILTSGRRLESEHLIDESEVPEGLGPDEDWAVVIGVDVDAEHRDEASLAGRYWSLIRHRFLGKGDLSVLDEFEGRTVAGFPLVTDPQLILDFYNDYGDVVFQEWYRP